MRNRGAIIIIENNKVALIKRVKGEEVYYVFPGGGIEVGETPKEAAKREAFEELGVHVKVGACIENVNKNGSQYYFEAKVVGGIFGSGQGKEYTASSKGAYEAMWVDLQRLGLIDVRPKEVADKLRDLNISDT